MVELGFPELTTEQIELLCQTAENAARKHILSKLSNKDVDRLRHQRGSRRNKTSKRNS